jgi:hypothetical protein
VNGRKARGRRAAELGLTRKGARLMGELERSKHDALVEMVATHHQLRDELDQKLAEAHEQVFAHYDRHKAKIEREHAA